MYVEPSIKAGGYYLTGEFTDPITGRAFSWADDSAVDGNMQFVMVSDGLYKLENVGLKTTDVLKVRNLNKRLTQYNDWFPDGMDNNRTVAEDGVYTIWFRPAGDGTAEDGWEWIHYSGDGDGCTADGTPQNPAANHGATKGGFMYKFEKTGNLQLH